MSKVRDLIAKSALVLGGLGVILSISAAPVLSATTGRVVQLVATPNTPDIVELNRSMWSKGDSVAAIYGTPIGEPLEVLFIDRARIIVPPEDPSLTLYTVDKSKGQNPLQMQTVRLVSKLALVGSGILLAAGVLHFVWKRWRKKPGATSPLL